LNYSVLSNSRSVAAASTKKSQRKMNLPPSSIAAILVLVTFSISTCQSHPGGVKLCQNENGATLWLSSSKF
jgi:hypothetical protein